MVKINKGVNHRPVLDRDKDRDILQTPEMQRLKELYQNMTKQEKARLIGYLITLTKENKTMTKEELGFAKVDRLVSKCGMVVKARMVQQIGAGVKYEGIPDDELINLLSGHIEKQEWIDAAIFVYILWYKDWRHHLGRDFLVEGGEPEHCQSAGV
ncbi:MAG TPA: hypothetical protein DCZ04_11655 [Syntrophorhabdus aromaticivorans]|jgi:hypothetical protein|nr:hypothetical protein [Syntrophorhabdus aromaticivorans]